MQMIELSLFLLAKPKQKIGLSHLFKEIRTSLAVSVWICKKSKSISSAAVWKVAPIMAGILNVNLELYFFFLSRCQSRACWGRCCFENIQRDRTTKKIQLNVPGSPTSDSIELESEEGRRFSAETPWWHEDFPHLLGMKQILWDLGAEAKMYGSPEGRWEQSELREWAPFFRKKKTQNETIITNGYFVRRSFLCSVFTHGGTKTSIFFL